MQSSLRFFFFCIIYYLLVPSNHFSFQLSGLPSDLFYLFLSFPGIGLVLFDPRNILVPDLTRFLVSRTLNGSSGCLGCFQKPTTISNVDMPSKGLAMQGKAVKNASTSEDFWTTSTHDMDNSAFQSQGSISSVSVTNQAFDPHGASSKTSNPTEFVNHGLILWNQTRQRWVGNNRSHSQNRKHQRQEPKLSWNASYEGLLGSNKPFSQPIPLAEMVDFLVDVWEQEGLYD